MFLIDKKANNQTKSILSLVTDIIDNKLENEINN